MVRKKRIGKWGKIATIFLILVLLVGGFFVVKNLIGEGVNPFLSVAVIGDQCNVAGSGTTDNVFTCPSECDVVGWKQCDQQTGDIPTVIFRTNGIIDPSHQLKFSQLYRSKYHPTEYGSKDAWISIDLNADNDRRGTLTSFRWDGYGGTLSSCSYRGDPVLGQNGLPMTTPDGYQIYYYAKYSELYVYNGPCQRNKFVFSSDTDIETNIQSISSYNNKNQEILGGVTNAFSCSTPWSVTSSGATKKSGTATYSSANAGEYSTPLLRLGQNEKFNFAGSINYAVIDASEACSIDQCNADRTGVIKCVEENQCRVKGDTQFCNAGEVCVDTSSDGSVIPARCESPIQIKDTAFQNADGDDVSGYVLDDQIFFAYRLSSELQTNAQVTLDLVNIDGSLIERKIENVALPQLQPNVVQFGSIGGIGNYKVIVKVSYNGKLTSPEEFEFSVANEFSMEIIGSSEGTVKTIYTNAPAIVELRVFGGDGKFTTADTSIKATLIQGNVKTELSYYDQDAETGIYKYYYNLPSVQVDAILRVEATAEKLGLQIKKTKDLIVKPAFIDLTFTNVANLVDLDEGITKTIKFTTADPQGDPLNVDSLIITATLPSGKSEVYSSSNVRNPSTGQYEFDYTFNQGFGAYFLKVDAQKDLYNSKSLTTPAINVISGGGQGLECTENAQCGVGKICVNNVCIDNVESPTYIYIIWGILAVLVIVAIIVVVRVARRPKKQVSPSITGLGDL